MVEEQPDLKRTEIFGVLGARWKDLSPDKKDEYNAKAKQQRELAAESTSEKAHSEAESATFPAKIKLTSEKQTAQAASVITTTVIQGFVEDLANIEPGKSISIRNVGTFKKLKEGNTNGKLAIIFTPPKKSSAGAEQ